MNEIEISLIVVALFAIWYVGYRVHQALEILTGVVKAQAQFAPIVERMGEMLDSVWESQATRGKVLKDHEQQAEEHKAMLDKLDKIHAKLR